MTSPQQIKCYRFSTSIEVDLFELDGPRVRVCYQNGQRGLAAETTLAAVRESTREMNAGAAALVSEFLEEIEQQMKEWGCAETTDAVPAE